MNQGHVHNGFIGVFIIMVHPLNRLQNLIFSELIKCEIHLLTSGSSLSFSYKKKNFTKRISQGFLRLKVKLSLHISVKCTILYDYATWIQILFRIAGIVIFFMKNRQVEVSSNFLLQIILQQTRGPGVT